MTEFIFPEINNNISPEIIKKNKSFDLSRISLKKKPTNKINPFQNNIFQLKQKGLDTTNEQIEQLNTLDEKINKKKIKLGKIKVNCIKSMILHQQQIPGSWIIKSNYKNLLSKVLKDPKILNYALFNKNNIKKCSSNFTLTEKECNDLLKNLPKEPLFISYTNPSYNQNKNNFINRKNFSQNIKFKGKLDLNKFNIDNSKNLYKNKKQISCVFTAGNIENRYNVDEWKNIKENNYEKEDSLMMTSLNSNTKKYNNNFNSEKNDKTRLKIRINKNLILPKII